MVLGADESFAPWAWALIPIFYIDTKNKIIQQLDLSRRLDLSINVIFCLDVHANPTTIQLSSPLRLFHGDP